MVIAEIVWETWREREGAFKKPSIALFLNTETPSETALKALSRAASEVMRPRLAKAETAGPGEEEFRTGNCASVRVPQGVVLQIDEGPDDFEGLLRGIAEGLRARGVDGGFDLYEFEGVAEIPNVSTCSNVICA